MDKEALKGFYQKNRIIIFPILVGISSLVLIFLVLIPQISKLISNNSSLTEVQKQSKFLEVKAQDLQDLDEIQLQKDLNLSLNALPSSKDYLEVIALIQSLLPQTDFSLQSLLFGQADSASSSKSYFTVKLELTGPKSSVNQLLTSIESTYRPMRVASIETSTPKQDSPLTNTVILLNVYYSPLPTTLGSTQQPLPKLSDKDKELVSTLARFVTTTPATSVDNTPRGRSDPFQ